MPGPFKPILGGDTEDDAPIVKPPVQPPVTPPKPPVVTPVASGQPVNVTKPVHHKITLDGEHLIKIEVHLPADYPPKYYKPY